MENGRVQSNLTRRERQILEVIYRLGEATANEIVAAMPDELANATVRTQLRTLEAKDAVNHRRDGKRFVYSPSVPRKSAAATAFRKVLEIFFGGSVENALAAHLADPKTSLNDDEIKRLRRLLSEHDQRGQK
jgi:BlaI family penicillinase repressor